RIVWRRERDTEYMMLEDIECAVIIEIFGVGKGNKSVRTGDELYDERICCAYEKRRKEKQYFAPVLSCPVHAAIASRAPRCGSIARSALRPQQATRVASTTVRALSARWRNTGLARR